MGFYKSKIGFLRKTLLKTITRLEHISIDSKFYGLFRFFNRVHFFIYTGMSFHTALNQRKSIAIAACRRGRSFFEKKAGNKRSSYLRDELVSLAYRFYLLRIVRQTTLQSILGTDNKSVKC